MMDPGPAEAGNTADEAPGAPAGAGRTAGGWLRANLEHSLPFLIMGAVLVGVGVWMELTQPHGAGHRFSFWILLAAVGLTVGAGGVALTLVEEPSGEPTPPANEDYVLVERKEWEDWKATLTAPETPEESPWSEGPEAIPAPPAETPASEPSRPAPLDPALVARASADLLKRPAPVPAPVEVASPPSTAGIRPLPPKVTPSPIATPAASPVPPPVAVPTQSRPPSAPQPTPIWSEEPVKELETILAELERQSAGTRSVPEAISGEPQERCISCGGAITAYSEQACVVCGRPLCEACLEASVADSRPSICPKCAARHQR